MYHLWEIKMEGGCRVKKSTSIFQLKTTTEDLTWKNPYCGRIDNSVLRHPMDSQSWCAIDERSTKIASDARNLQIGISTDGVDVNRGKKSQCMDHLTTIYNLPPWLCMKRKFIMLSLLIFSLSCNDIGAYLRPLIDDLQVLFKTGLKHMIYTEKRILIYVHCYMDYQ